MQETADTQSDRGNNIVNELCDAVRYIGDVSYAILPRDVAHNLADLKKSFLTTIRSLIDKWEQKCNRDTAEGAPEPIS